MSSDQKLIENYGYVPFFAFQWVVLGLQVYMIYNYNDVNKFLENMFSRYTNLTESTKQNLKNIILTLPFLSMVYYDVRYSSFSFKNLGVNPEYNDTIKQILNILGSYAIIHIFAQDTGLKTTLFQTGLVQTHALFIIMSIGMAYSITQNRSQSILALILFYHLKYVIGSNVLE